ncbi:MAG: TRAP transporter small permease subunit [Pseudomonadota bacterium]
MTAWLYRLEEGVIALLLVALTLLVFFEVVLRFGFGTGFLWAQEVSLYLGAWFILVGASYALREGAHIAVDAVVNLLDGTVKRVVAAIAVASSLLYCGILMTAAWAYLERLFQLGIEMEDVALPRWIGQSCLFLGFALLALRLALLLVAIVRGRADGFKHLDEAAEALDALAHQAPEASGREAGRR